MSLSPGAINVQDEQLVLQQPSEEPASFQGHEPMGRPTFMVVQPVRVGYMFIVIFKIILGLQESCQDDGVYLLFSFPHVNA